MKRIKLILLTAALSLFIFTSCGNKDDSKEKTSLPELTETVSVEKKYHNWYYFTDNSFVQTDKPQNAPVKQALPWTETIRISSASTSNTEEAFAIVNRLGVLSFQGKNISLASDKIIFDDRTAGNLIFANDVPIFSVYKSAFFNDTIKAPDYAEDSLSHLFLIQFDPVAKISYPLVNSTSLTDELNSEVTDFVWNNDSWLCAIKTITHKKNQFSYVSWKQQIPLLSLSPGKAKENIMITPSTSEDFRKAKSQIPYEEAPERIKGLLTGFSKDLPFTIEVKTAGGGTPREYVNKIENSSEKDLLGKGIIAQSWSGVLFEDGTLYLEGALPGKHILRNGKPIAIRLPKLPAGFVYSEFTISDTTLYASWEETSFYKTGRSGFIQVDLDETLYSKLI